MEFLWNLEDKWKVSTTAAIALCVCTSALLIAAVCVAVLVRRGKKKRVAGFEEAPPCMEEEKGGGRRRGEVVKKVLMGSVRWSGACKWGEEKRSRRRERLSPPLLKGEVGWQSNNSESLVWQRPILMGEKCELPSFSGLILYDDKGIPLHHNASSHHHQVNISAVERVSLKELL